MILSKVVGKLRVKVATGYYSPSFGLELFWNEEQKVSEINVEEQKEIANLLEPLLDKEFGDGSEA